MSSDDELRHVIRNELPSHPGGSAQDVLAGMNPTLTRLARRRIATITVSAVLVSAGVIGAAGYVLQPSGATIRTAAGENPTYPSSPSGTPRRPNRPPHRNRPFHRNRSMMRVLLPGDGSDVEEATPAPVELTIPRTEPAPVDSADGDDSTDGGSVGGPSPSPLDDRTAPGVPRPSSSTAPTTPTSVIAHEPTVPTTASPTTTRPPTTTHPPTTSVTVTTTAAPISSVRFDCDCGWVLADLTTTPPRIVEVVPVGGYRYRVEDPDGDRVVVQFNGWGRGL